ncbi:MAG: hypothetical protein FJ087_20605, partial [Deltaproteobacteria bacterium]|nr:hypothetical protein [Deltaproteobacteria bacterium]
MRSGLALLAMLALLGVACGGGSGPGGTDPGLPDAPVSDEVATGADAEEDGATRDAEPDAATDPAGEAATDAAIDAATDLPPADAPDEDAASDTAGDPAGDAPPVTDLAEVPPDCPEAAEPFDYKCEVAAPETCPGGYCLLSLCIAPEFEDDRWASCGDLACDPCETATGCPADCAAPPATTGKKEYVNGTTITVWVHGFTNKSPEKMKETVYGADRGCSGEIFDMMRALGIDRGCGDDAEGALAPDQFAKLEYYGDIPVGWLGQADIDEISEHPWDGASALHRYALILAKYIRHKIDTTGASHVNLSCHSMGCLVTRYMIEHDFEHLASGNRFVRWFTSAAVIAGARLARLYDNPQVQQGAGLIGLELSDFVVMHPDFVADNAAVWDHKPWEGNNPLFAGGLIHHVGGTDPRIEEALNIALLDLDNPGDLPNDGIMYTEDEYFHAQAANASFLLPSGEASLATHSLVYEYHMQVPETDAAAVLATAALFHGRKVFVTLEELELKDDREADDLFDLSEHGR